MKQNRLVFGSLKTICGVLRSFGINHTTPNTFVSIKKKLTEKRRKENVSWLYYIRINSLQKNVLLWRTLHDLLILHQYDLWTDCDLQRRFERLWKRLSIFRCISYVKYRMKKMGYQNNSFFIIPFTDSTLCGVELIIAFSWVLEQTKLYDRFVSKFSNSIMEKTNSNKSGVNHFGSKKHYRRNEVCETKLKRLLVSISRVYFLSRILDQKIQQSERLTERLSNVKEIGNFKFQDGLEWDDIPLEFNPSTSGGRRQKQNHFSTRNKIIQQSTQVFESFLIFFRWMESISSKKRLLSSVKTRSRGEREEDKVDESLIEKYYYGNVTEEENYDDDMNRQNNENFDDLFKKILILKKHLEMYTKKNKNNKNLQLFQKRIEHLNLMKFIEKYILHFVDFKKRKRKFTDSTPTSKKSASSSSSYPNFIEKSNSGLQQRHQQQQQRQPSSMCIMEVKRVEKLVGQVNRNLENERKKNLSFLTDVLTKIGYEIV